MSAAQFIPVPTKAYVPPGKEKPSGLEWYCEAMMFQLPDGRNLTVWEAMDREKASKIAGANQVIRLPSNGTLPVKVYVSWPGYPLFNRLMLLKDVVPCKTFCRYEYLMGIARQISLLFGSITTYRFPCSKEKYKDFRVGDKASVRNVQIVSFVNSSPGIWQVECKIPQ